ncbi:MAG: hypothetical protein NVSMB18_21260 [Acetobacteraceae bacterium]
MSDARTSAAPVTELKASAHLMLLDPGVFCIFSSPGTAPPDAATGLPGVRVSRAPAAGSQGTVTVSGLDGDGWIAGSEGATLVRVTGGPAQVLVTVYQAPEGEQEAPKLQVLRLSEAARPAPAPAAEPAPVKAPTPSPDSTPLEVAAHVYGRGDVAGRLGEWMGEPGSKRWVEGFGLQPARDVPTTDIEYQAVLGRGWLSPWAEGGQFCGSRGMSLPILGLRVRLRGASAERFSVAVQATFVDGARIGPVGDGEACEAPSLAALEAFRVVIQPKAAARAEVPRPAAKTVTRTAPKAAPAPAPAKSARPAAKAPMAKPAPTKPGRRGPAGRA